LDSTVAFKYTYLMRNKYVKNRLKEKVSCHYFHIVILKATPKKKNSH